MFSGFNGTILQYWWKLLPFASLLQLCLKPCLEKYYITGVFLWLYLFIELIFAWPWSTLSVDPSDLAFWLYGFRASEHLNSVLSSNFNAKRGCLLTYSVFLRGHCLHWRPLYWRPFYADQRPIWLLSMIDMHHQTWPIRCSFLPTIFSETKYLWHTCEKLAKCAIKTAFTMSSKEKSWIVIKHSSIGRLGWVSFQGMQFLL